MKQMQLITVLLDLIGKNAERHEDRFDIPLALYITACKVNNIEMSTALVAINESWNDIQLVKENQEDSGSVKH